MNGQMVAISLSSENFKSTTSCASKKARKLDKNCMLPEKLAYDLKLPYPPSVNAYWRTFRGRMILSAEARSYKVRVQAELLLQGIRNIQKLTGRLGVDILVYPPDKRRRDLSNTEKGIGDTLQKLGFFKDDSQIDRLQITRMEKGGFVRVRIFEISPQAPE